MNAAAASRSAAAGRHRIVSRLGRVASLIAVLAFAGAPSAAGVLIERTFMPHGAAPSSFAVGLPGGIGFCFDPVRGGLSYAWTGGFVDVTPARPGPGKFIAAVTLAGPLMYQENGVAPLRRGDPGRVPVVEFAGYTLREEAIEFRYTLDGTPVREEIAVRPGGGGLVRRFHVGGGGDARWWHVVAGRPPVELRREPTGALVLEVIFAASR